MSFSPYLGFPGTAREAMTAHAAIFGATDLQIMTGADVIIPLGPTFWSPVLGMLTDRQGATWMIPVAE